MGVQASGAGRSNGRASFDEFSNRRSVLRKRLPLTAVPLSFPPFGPAKAALAKVDFPTPLTPVVPYLVR